jgi:CheY-like chemotaxis protein
MLKREEALRLIRSIVDFADGSLTSRESGAELILEIALKPDEIHHTETIAGSHLHDPSWRYSVLHVEDTGRFSDLVYYYLRETYNVDTAQTGEEGLERAMAKNYDYVLMDLKLGKGMNGYELTELLRKMDAYEKVPIIAISGYTSRLDVEKCIEAGCSAFLSKPFLKEDLIRLMQKLEPRLNTKI